MIVLHPSKTVNNFRSFALGLLIAQGLNSCASEPPPPESTVAEDVAKPPDLLYGETLTLVLEQVALADSQKNAWGEEQLIQFSSSPDYLVRVRAVKALGGDFFRKLEKPHQVLLRSVNDEHWLVRSMAIKALAKESNDESRQVLTERLKVEENERVQKYLEEGLKQP